MSKSFNPIIKTCQSIRKLKSSYSVFILNFSTILRSIIPIIKCKNYKMDVCSSDTFNLICFQFEKIFESIGSYLSRSCILGNIKITILFCNYNQFEPMIRGNPEFDFLTGCTIEFLHSDWFDVFRKFIENGISILNSDIDNYFNVSYDIRTDYYRQVLPDLSSYRSIQDNAVIISHIPLDYHLKYKSICIIDLFTGNYNNRATLFKKYEKIDFIPFIPITHFLFGDPYIICSVLSNDDKKKIINNIFNSGNLLWEDSKYMQIIMSLRSKSSTYSNMLDFYRFFVEQINDFNKLILVNNPSNE